MEPKLSFCIPTYNRGERCYKNVKRILESPLDCIEVVVSNNNSEDNTLALLSSIQDNRLKIYSNETNIGVINQVHVLTLAKARWMLLMSDEDAPIVDNFPKLLNLIEKNEHIGMIRTSVVGHKRAFFKKDLILKKGGQSFLTAYQYGRYLGGILFNKAIIDHTKDYEHYNQFAYRHLVPIFDAVDKYPVMLTKLPTIDILEGEDSYRDVKSESYKGTHFQSPLSRFHQFIYIVKRAYRTNSFSKIEKRELYFGSFLIFLGSIERYCVKRKLSILVFLLKKIRIIMECTNKIKF